MNSYICRLQTAFQFLLFTIRIFRLNWIFRSDRRRSWFVGGVCWWIQRCAVVETSSFCDVRCLLLRPVLDVRHKRRFPAEPIGTQHFSVSLIIDDLSTAVTDILHNLAHIQYGDMRHAEVVPFKRNHKC